MSLNLYWKPIKNVGKPHLINNDLTSFLNICAHKSIVCFQLVKPETQNTVHYLFIKGGNISNILAVFITDLEQHYNQNLCVEIGTADDSISKSKNQTPSCSSASLIKHDCNFQWRVSKRLTQPLIYPTHQVWILFSAVYTPM